MISVKKRIVYSTLIGVIIIMIAIVTTIQLPQNSKASAPAGLTTRLASSSSWQVGTSTTAQILAQNDNSCSSRVISTTNQPIMLSFGFALDQGGVYGSSTLSANQGVLQGASTTVAYDSGLYGCGTTSAIAVQTNTNIATSTVTINQYR